MNTLRRIKQLFWALTLVSGAIKVNGTPEAAVRNSWVSDLTLRADLVASGENLIFLVLDKTEFNRAVDEGVSVVAVQTVRHPTRPTEKVFGEGGMFVVRAGRPLGDLLKVDFGGFRPSDNVDWRIQIFGRRRCILATVAAAKPFEEVIIEPGCVIVFRPPGPELWDAVEADF